MDFKKISFLFIMCVLSSSCDFFLKPFYENDTFDYSANWYIINETDECLHLKSWFNDELTPIIGMFKKESAVQIYFNDILALSKVDDNESISFLSFIKEIDSELLGTYKCDSITFESCDGSKVYHVWRTSLEENGEHPFYQEENWRYESTDNGYTSNWYYTLTPEFVEK